MLNRWLPYYNAQSGSLNLRMKNLTDDDIPELIQFLMEYPDVQTLDLSLNNIGDRGVAEFAERNQTIIQVNFAGNNIGDRGVAAFAYKNQTVKQINFSNNLITEQGISNFAEINQTCYTSQFSKIQFH